MHKIKHMIENNPDRVYSIIETLVAVYGEEIEEYFDCHIKSEEMYDEAVALFKNTDGTSGAHWKNVDEISKKSGICFEKEEYTDLDYAYTVNMFYSDYGEVARDPDLLFKMALVYLEDKDYPGEASERAYHNAKKRIKYFTEK